MNERERMDAIGDIASDINTAIYGYIKEAEDTMMLIVGQLEHEGIIEMDEDEGWKAVCLARRMKHYISAFNLILRNIESAKGHIEKLADEIFRICTAAGADTETSGRAGA